MRFMTFLAALACIGAFVPAARAGWVAYPLETRLIEADMVAVGTIGKTKSTFKRGRDYAIAEMQITEVLKGNPELKTVDVAFPAKALVEADRFYKPGDGGVWIMRQDATESFYWIDQLTDRQPLADKEQLAQQVKRVEELEWGKETKGVQLLVRGQVAPDTDRDMLPTKKQLKAPGIPVLQVFIKNVSDKPIYVCDFAGDKPVKITCTEAAGRAEPVEMYGETWRKSMNQGNFLCIRPGQVKPVGGAGGAFRMRPFSQPGQYALTATYTANRDGKIYKLDNVWTGQVTSNTLKLNFSVKRAQPAS